MFLCEFESFPFPNVLGMIRVPQVKAKYFALQLKILFNYKLEKIHIFVYFIYKTHVCMYFKDKNIARFISHYYSPSLVSDLHLTH